MALSGSLTTTSYDGCHYKLSWTATQSVADNSSTISWTLTNVKGNSGWYAERTLEVVIAGTTVHSKTAREERYPGTVATGTLTIDHNADGTKSFSASVRAALYYETVNCTGSASFTLDAIPRKATIDSAPNFTDEENPTITYTNTAGSAVTTLQACISLTGAEDEIAYRDISKTGTSYTFSLTDAERTVLRNACTTANSRSVFFFIKTVIGSTTYYSYVAKTMSIVNANPTLSPTVTDVDSAMVQLTGNSSLYLVKYYSDAAFAIGATALKGASITSQKVWCGILSSTASSGTLSDVTSDTFIFSATDSRGNTTTKVIVRTLISYVKLTCNLNASNPDVDGNLTLTISGNYFNDSFGATANTLTVQYRASSDGGSTWGSWTAVTATKNGNTYSGTVSLTGLDYQTTYAYQARAYDKIETITTSAKKVKSTPVFDWGENDFSVNVPLNVDGDVTVTGAGTFSGELKAQGYSVALLQELNGYKGLIAASNDGTSFMRTTIQGLIPYQSGGSGSLGTSGWPFLNIHGTSIYANGRQLATNKVLWSGGLFMNANQTITLSEAVSAQPNGIVLIFSYYSDSAAQNWNFSSHFVPKQFVSLHSGSGMDFTSHNSTGNVVMGKYLYIKDTQIVGYTNNDLEKAGDEFNVQNIYWVLRYVIGV